MYPVESNLSATTTSSKPGTRSSRVLQPPSLHAARSLAAYTLLHLHQLGRLVSQAQYGRSLLPNCVASTK